MRRTLRTSALQLLSLEDRAVPANNLTVIDSFATSVNVDEHATGKTITFRTTGPDAQLSLGDIQNALLSPNVDTVILSTAVAPAQTDGSQAGDILWDEDVVSSALSLNGLGTGKTLKLITDNSSVTGHITLRGVMLFGGATDGLNLELDSSAANGNVSFLAGIVSTVDLSVTSQSNVLIKAGTGNFTYEAGSFGGIVSEGSFTVTANTVDLGSLTLNVEDGFAVTGTTINLNNTSIETSKNISVDGTTNLTGSISMITKGLNSSVSFDGTVDGPGVLTLDTKTATFADDVGAVTPLTQLLHHSGTVSHGANPFNVNTIDIGTFLDAKNGLAFFGNGSGPVTGNLFVGEKGVLTPGGVGSIGILNVTGSISFDGGGRYSPDLGTTASDQLNVDGSVSINFGRLAAGIGSGTLATGGSANILTYTSGLSGSFDNAPFNSSLVVGSDAVSVNSYSSSPLTVTQLAANNTPGSDLDGTGYTIKVTGGGEIVTLTDPTFTPSVVVRNTTAKSVLTITTKANGSDDLVTFKDIAIGGPLANLAAGKVVVGGSVRVSGLLKAATLESLATNAVLEGGGLATEKTTLTTRTLGLDSQISLKAGLTSLKVAGDINGHVTAANVVSITGASLTGNVVSTGPLGTIKVKGALNGLIQGTTLTLLDAGRMDGQVNITGNIKTIQTLGSLNADVNAGSITTLKAGAIDNLIISSITSNGAITTFNVTRDAGVDLQAQSVGKVTIGGKAAGVWTTSAGVKSMAAGQLNNFNLTATFLETLTVKGNAKTFTNGNVDNSFFVLTGNTGAALGSFGLKTASISGTVLNTTFAVEEGNVASFIAGRFHGSILHVDFNGVAFNGGNFTLGTFKTTATTIGNVAHPLNWAFAGSQVAARKIGTAELSGLNTTNIYLPSSPFGFTYELPNAVIKVKNAGPGTIAANQLFPNSLPAGFNVGDFNVIDL